MKRLALVVVLALAACGAGQAIHGTFVLTDANVDYSSSDCSGTGGYNDIRPGTTVVVKDGSGTIIGTSALVYDAAGSSGGQCAYTFETPVKDADFYSIEVSHRGGLTYSKTDLAANGWKVDATLGGN